nr:C40 family peptidase [Paenarthrobacter sp. DKR-5]
MSSHTLARHRADAVRTNPLNVISKAVSSNAGSVGRQAAVLAAASGLIVTMGLPAQAADTQTPSKAIEASADMTPVAVSTPQGTNVKFERPAVTSTPAPAVAAPAAQAPAAAAPAAGVTVQAETITAAATPAAAKTDKVSGGNAAVAAAAYAGIGHPYVWGGTSTSGWDCSGFVQWAYAQAGISIPRTNQWVGMTQTSAPAPGDLVVQNGGVHVGIYVGNGMMISALNPSQGTLLLPVSATGSSVFYTLR